MKLREIYELVVKLGIEHDVRGNEGVKRVLDRSKKELAKLDEAEKQFYDHESERNPFTDTRILYGSGDEEVKSVFCGIDMETPELLLADRLREKGRNIDLVIAHHPEGIAQAALYGVMDLQADLFHHAGIPINVAESVLASRISEVERTMMPVNHQRAVDAARLLGISFMCVHTPADNMANHFLQDLMDRERPVYLSDVLELLTNIPEYHYAKTLKAGPKLVVGDKNKRAGKIVVDMTGGTSGPHQMYEKMEAAGIGTIICMHLQEKHREEAKKYNINVIVAGHMASDSLGLNLVLDRIESQGVEIIPASGFIRISRL